MDAGTMIRAILCTICLVLLILIFVVTAMLRKGGQKFSEEAKRLKEKKLEILLYGAPINFGDGVDYTSVTQLSEQSLGVSENCLHPVVVINDLDETAQLSENDIYLLYKLVYEKGYNLYYLGLRYLTQLETIKLYPEPEKPLKTDSTNMSFVRIRGLAPEEMKSETTEVVMGILNLWRTTDMEILKEKPEYLSETLIFSFMSDILLEDTDELD